MPENNNNNNNIQVGVIIALLVVIAIMGFFLWKYNNIAWNTNIEEPTVEKTNIENNTYETLSLTVIDDKRCVNCPTDAILEQLIQLPSVSNSKITRKDFSDEGVADYLKENNITVLPLIVFSTNNIDVSKDPAGLDNNGNQLPKVNTFLTNLPKGEYSLSIGATFNPFEDRSDRGYLKIDKATLDELKNNSYIKGSADAKITWIEYSDLNCPFCAKLHNSGTVQEVTSKYKEDLNLSYNHFPLNPNSQVWSEVLECLGAEKWTEAFYALMEKSFSERKATKEYLIKEAVNLGASEDKIEKCLANSTFANKIENQRKKGTELFNITGTPGNVLINNETGEYEVISWAYPSSKFEEVIDKLLK